MTAGADGVHPRSDGVAAGRADAGHAEGVGEADAAGGQAVEVRRAGRAVAEGCEERADVLAGEPENVGAGQ